MGDHSQLWTRRDWLWLVGASTLAAGAMLRAQGQRAWGVQLYTVREQLAKQPLETLKAIAGIGYKEVELFGPDAAKIVQLSKEAGLTPVGTHIQANDVLGDKTPDALDRLFDGIAKLDLKYALVGYIMPNDRGKDSAAYKKFGEEMNRAGERAKKAGLVFGYHHHAFEFGKLPDGTRPIDIIIETFDPALVKFEVDVFWVSVTGNDPVELLNKLANGKRVGWVHLKDKAKGTTVHFDEMVPKTAFAEVGSGAIDFPAVLKAAQAASVDHYLVEQDFTPADPIASLKKSFDYLSHLT
jgi:sugar phosphate isomerase/epimerase